MNLPYWSPADLQALRAFYDAGQTWSFDQIAGAVRGPEMSLRTWLEESPVPRRNPLVLPAFRAGKVEPDWFAIAFTEAQTEALRLELNAFVGPVGCDFRGHRAVLDLADPIEAAVSKWAGGPFVFRFTVLPASRPVVRGALQRLRQVWRLRPVRPSFAFRTTAALLREFFTALTNVDVTASQRWLDELAASGRLSAENLRFLEIERLGALGLWPQLALHPQFSLLVAIRRPRRITGLLVEAVWRAEMAHFMADKKPAEAVEYMRTNFLPRYEALLRSRAGLKHPAVVLVFLVAAVAMNPPRREQITGLLDELTPGTPEHDFAQAVASRLVAELPGPTKQDPLASLKALVAQNNFDSAWVRLGELPNTPETCGLRLECAAEINTPEAAQSALDALAALADTERKILLGRRRPALLRNELQRVVAEAGSARPTDWESWLTAITADPDWPQAMAFGQGAMEAWGIHDYQNDPGRVRRLAGQLQELPATAWVSARFALPYLAGYFLNREARGSVFAPIYQTLLLLLATDDQFGSEDWALVQNLATGVLDAGPDEKSYVELVEALTAVWDTRGEASRLDWALDLLDALVDAPVKHLTVRDSFFSAVWRTFNIHPRRINDAHRTLFGLLCSDLKREVDFAALPAIPPAEAHAPIRAIAETLLGKIVGIYTLTASAGERAKRVIQQQFPGADVRLNHDHVGSARLESLAREADYLLVVAKSAKHAATDFIKQKRPRAKAELIYPSGRGSSSIVTALLQTVADEA